MNTGLFALRRIDPPAPLLAVLTKQQQIYEFENGSYYVDDEVTRDASINLAITGWKDDRGQWVPGCTLGWGIFDSDYKQHAFYRDLQKCMTALERAQPKIVTEFELDQEDEAADPGATVSVGVAPKPAEVREVATSRPKA